MTRQVIVRVGAVVAAPEATARSVRVSVGGRGTIPLFALVVTSHGDLQEHRHEEEETALIELVQSTDWVEETLTSR